jgi:hypothetical protein
MRVGGGGGLLLFVEALFFECGHFFGVVGHRLLCLLVFLRAGLGLLFFTPVGDIIVYAVNEPAQADSGETYYHEPFVHIRSPFRAFAHRAKINSKSIGIQANNPPQADKSKRVTHRRVAIDNLGAANGRNGVSHLDDQIRSTKFEIRNKYE